MQISTIELRKLQADEGMVLTNGDTFSDVGGSVYIATNEDLDNWNEITDEEADRIKAEKLEELERASLYSDDAESLIHG